VFSFQFQVIVAAEAICVTSPHAAISFFWGSSFAELQSATHEPKACVFHFSSSSSSSSSGYPMLKTTRMAMPSDNGHVQGYM